MRTFVIGDIHGGYKALKQCLKRSKFDFKKDLLITLGDVVDGWPDSSKVVELLLTIKNRIDIRGNHDDWFWKYLLFREDPAVWLEQGGESTLKSYEKILKGCKCILNSHLYFFNRQHYYYIDDNNRLFVHGGYNWHLPLKESSQETLMWDRKAFNAACQWELHHKLHPDEPITQFKEFSEVFVGHTSTLSVGWRMERDTLPLHVSNMWNLDTGGGWQGKLTIMDVNTKEYWQSDIVSTLYSGISI